jgi:hypothetical protein
MTLLSCIAIGLAFAIAVSLLVLAGVLIGWNLPRLLSWLRARGAPGSPRDGEDRVDPRGGGA